MGWLDWLKRSKKGRDSPEEVASVAVGLALHHIGALEDAFPEEGGEATDEDIQAALRECLYFYVCLAAHHAARGLSPSEFPEFNARMVAHLTRHGVPERGEVSGKVQRAFSDRLAVADAFDAYVGGKLSPGDAALVASYERLLGISYDNPLLVLCAHFHTRFTRLLKVPHTDLVFLKLWTIGTPHAIGAVREVFRNIEARVTDA